MPGLSQLKKFENDIQSLGDELTLRSSRGEKPVRVPIPKGIPDKDDSEEFVLGMPEIAAPAEDSAVDDDLSEITGIGGGKSDAADNSADAPSFEAPDLSSIINPIIPDTAADDGLGMPDLSMFMDEPEEEVVQESEPVEEVVSVADMSFEALLNSAGFDGSEGAEEEPPVEEETSTDDNYIEEMAEEIPDAAEVPEPEPVAPVDTTPGAALSLDEIMGAPTKAAEPVPEPEPEPFADSFDESLDEIPEPAESFDEPSAAGETNFEPLDDLSLPDDFDTPDSSSAGTDFAASAGDDFDSLGDLDLPDDFGSDTSFDTDSGSAGDFDSGADFGADTNFGGDTDFGGGTDFGSDTDFAAGSDFDAGTDFGTDTDFAADTDFGTDTDTDFSSGSDSAAGDDSFSVPDFDSDNLDTPAFDSDAEAEALSDFSGLADMPDGFEQSEPMDLDAQTDEIPEYDLEEDSGEGFDDENAPVEVFDTSGMDDDIDFGIKETDSQLGGDFEMGDADEFAMEGSDFEISGFTDVETAKLSHEQKPAKKAADLDVPDFSGAKEGDELPPNTLSDAQYKQFLKNLAEYPLNVRLAFENLIVQDEFTDDAEFEIIEKILNKAPARQVAGLLEKMLDTSIPVPRDFEHRTAEEYEAYKKSISYQLRNRILPGMLVGIVMLFVLFGLFQFSKYCIYMPMQANSYYKQGYAFLEADEYPQSEIYFQKAAEYKKKKDWFFKYARGYRNKKQYQRAERMYKNILNHFNHDKEAGLEYARMEMDDLANYEAAEEIIKREVLDYHVNDNDATLLLGDVYLDWGTEKDPEKLDLAMEQYAHLIERNGITDLYESRLMRYYIRKDELSQVLYYKEKFTEREKSLGGEDWTELSGYLLDKLYGNLAPSEEYLREKIEDVLKLLNRAIKLDGDNPVAYYNLGNYYVRTNDPAYVEASLQQAVEKFNDAPHLKRRDIYKYIDSYRLLGENYIKTMDVLRAQEEYSKGISIYTKEKEIAGFEGNEQIGHLYADLADINYFAAADYDTALNNYEEGIALGYDNQKIRYRLGYIHYNSKDYGHALGEFMKAGEGIKKEQNLLLAMGNTLSLRSDDYAAEGYYEQLVSELSETIAENSGSIFPQTSVVDADLITTYLYATNNYGVSMYRLAKRTGDSSKNAQAIIQLQQSLKAWDSLTRDQKSLLRLDGSNLAQENIKYIVSPITEFEPSIYNVIPKTLTDNENL